MLYYLEETFGFLCKVNQASAFGITEMTLYATLHPRHFSETHAPWPKDSPNKSIFCCCFRYADYIRTVGFAPAGVSDLRASASESPELPRASFPVQM